MALTGANTLIGRLEERMADSGPLKGAGKIKVGVDLGTAYLVVTVLDEANQPLAGAMTFAQVVRDGVVVDYWGAVEGVRALKEEIEKKTGLQLGRAATAIPPVPGWQPTRATPMWWKRQAWKLPLWSTNLRQPTRSWGL